jgi:hypothetical protein
MMPGRPFYHGITRRTIIAFGNLFSNLRLQRWDAANTLIQDMPVPIAYGPRDKMLGRVEADPKQKNQVKTTLPRLSFEITGYQYDSDRSMGRTKQIICQSGVDPTRKQVYSASPYNIRISMYIATKNREDALQLFEQIAPYFRPEYTLDMELQPGLNIRHNVPIVLNGGMMDDPYEGSYEDVPIIINTLNFTLKTWMYGPETATGYIQHVTANVNGTEAIYTADGTVPGAPINESWIESFDFVPNTNPPAQFLLPAIYSNFPETYSPVVSVIGAGVLPSLLLDEPDVFFASLLTTTGGPVSLSPSFFSDSDFFFLSAATIEDLILSAGLTSDADVFFSSGVSTSNTVSPSLHTDGDTFFNISANAGAVAVSPALLSDGDSFFISTAGIGTVSLASPLFNDGDNFFNSSASVGPVALSPSVFNDVDAFFSGSLATGPVAIAPSLVSDGDVFFSGVLSTVDPINLSPALFNDADSFFVNSLSAGPVVLSPALFNDTDTIFTSGISTSTIILNPSLVNDSETIFSPTMDIEGDTFFNIIITVGTTTVSPLLFNDGDTFFNSSLVRGIVSVSPSLVSDSDTFFTSTLTALPPGAVSLQPSLVSDADTFFSSSVVRGAVSLSPSVVTDGDTFFNSSLTRGTVTLAPTRHTDADTFFNSSLAVGSVALAPTLVTDMDTFYNAVVSTGIVVMTQSSPFNDSDSFFDPFVGTNNGIAAHTTNDAGTANVVNVWTGVPSTSDVETVLKLSSLPTGTNYYMAVSTNPALPVGSCQYFGPFTSEADVTATYAAGRVLRLSATGLTPNTQYYYALRVDNTVFTGHVGKFKTITTSSAAMSFEFTAASCARPTAAAQSTMNKMVATHPNALFFMSLGDYPYASGQTTDAAFSKFRDDLLIWTNDAHKQIPVEYVYSDSDFGYENAAAAEAAGAGTRDVSVANARRRVPLRGKRSASVTADIAHSFVIGRVRFVVTDNRSNAESIGGTQNVDRTILGETQKAWFKNEILAAKNAGQFVVWMSDNAVTGAPVFGSTDLWSNYSQERAEIYNYINAQQMGKRIMVVAGDMHALAYYNGTGTHDFATGGGSNLPVAQCAAIDSGSSSKGGPYTIGPINGDTIAGTNVNATTNQWGHLSVTDTGGDSITVTFTGHNYVPATDTLTTVIAPQAITLTKTPQAEATPKPRQMTTGVIPAVAAGGTSSIKVRLGAEPVVGNLILIAVAIDKRASAVQMPAGFSLVTENLANTNSSVSVYSKTADGTERDLTVGVTMTAGVAGSGHVVTVMEWQDTLETGAVSVYSGNAVTSVSATLGAATTESGTALAIYAVDTQAVAGTVSFNNGFSSILSLSDATGSSSGAGMVVATKDLLTAGTTPTVTATWTGADEACLVLIAIKPIQQLSEIPTTSMLLGTNVGGASTNNAMYPFINIMSNASLWAPRNTNTGTFTQNQGTLVASNPTDWFFIYLSDSGRGLPQGRYTVLNPNGCKLGFGAFNEYVNPRYTLAEPDDNAGYFTSTEFQFDWPGTQPSTTGLFMMAQGSVSGVKVIMPGQRANYDAGEIFAPEFLAYEQGLGSLSPLRMMIWAGTNVTVEADVADRTLPTSMTYINDSDTRAIPWEVQAALANKLGRDLWLNIPVTATEAYVTAMATTFKNTLNANRRVFLETGNEIWNNFNEIARGTAWVRYITHTKIRATVNSATGVVTSVGHGLAPDARIQSFSTRLDRLAGIGDSDGTSGYMTARGSTPLYVEVLSADTFKVWTEPVGHPSRAAAGWAPGRTTIDYLVFDEPGKDTGPLALDRNYAALSLRNFQLFDAVFANTERVKTIMSGQAANKSWATNRLAEAAPAARTDYFAIAPYYTGILIGAQTVITSGTVLPKAWTNAGGTDRGGFSTTTFGLYAQASTPTDDQILAGTGTGFVAKRSWKHHEDGRNEAPVTISVGSPAVIDWGTTAPANGTSVKLYTTGALPAGFSASDPDGNPETVYRVVNASGNTSNLSLTAGGVAIDTTAAGTGSHTATTEGESTVIYTPAPAITGLVNDTIYRAIFLMTDPDGYTWRIEKDITVNAAGGTIIFDDSYSNQAKRDAITLLNRTGPWITDHQNVIAASPNPNVKLVNYESGSHWFIVSNNVPAPFFTWMYDGYVESQEYADSQKRYMHHLAARGIKIHEIFTDLTDQSTSWTLANSLTDTTDKRYLMVAAQNGLVPITTLLNISNIQGTAFPNEPTYPQVVATFADPTLNYSIIKGNGSGNYQIVGNELRMIAGSGVNWIEPQNRIVSILANNGLTETIFDVTSMLGSNWYEGDALYAMGMTEQTSASPIVPRIGGNITAVTPGTLDTVAGLLSMVGASTYVSSTAGVSNLTIDRTKATLLMAVVAQGGTNATSQTIVQFGASQFCRLATSATNANLVRWRLAGNGAAGGADTSFVTQSWSTTAQVFWIFFDPSADLVYVGRNQTTDNGTGTTFTAFSGNTLVRDVRWQAGTNPKIGSIESVQRAGMTLAQAKSLVAKLQALHSIP